MNALTKVKLIKKLTEKELALGTKATASWHNDYKDSAWIYIGGLPFDLTEGDVVTVFSQFGEVVNVNLVRDRKTGKSKGFAFLCYADQRSTILSVDNLNGVKVVNRTIRVDHVKDYKPPELKEGLDEEYKTIYTTGCAPEPLPVDNEHYSSAESEPDIKIEQDSIDEKLHKVKKDKKLKKDKKSKKSKKSKHKKKSKH